MYPVDKIYKESEFVVKAMPGYQREWTRYGYFQLTQEEKIKAHQQVIVMKMVYCWINALNLIEES